MSWETLPQGERHAKLGRKTRPHKR